ncbi:LysR family transcriptional regulator [Brevibacillus reuszeri]|uniref:Transcriptional regulator n=1 Tax=Brevibacillus reuszeri TaxID=54915 RepID=A0A0K9YJG8_9BACL|nr:LysR family transcriptional regulator [Brevibacillus reuszeri]KNB68819.1 transcriptional regulator [Brevibacillus reuszeri]MED1859126.1 LysR family transcriptional regulator [Brevibacillus reuszeri]GED69345.1 LysR family transcriptional regulator [Brevibacillus reuszeri]
MELRNLKTFQVAAEHLNLTKAAELLGYSQPTITLQIQALERELGHPLLNRVGKRTFLTPAGKTVKQYTDQLFLVLQHMEEGLNSLHLPVGPLVVAAPEFYCTQYMPQMLKAYVETHPQVNLQVISCTSQEALKKIHAHEADIGIIAGASSQPEIFSTIVDLEEFALVASPDIIKGRTMEEALAAYPFLSYQEGCNLDGFITQCLLEIAYVPPSVIKCSSEETIKRAVLNETGVALLSTALVARELRTGELSELYRFSKKAETSLVCLDRRKNEAAIQTFIELVKDVWQTVREE